ncbi:MAG: Na(+)-translocating NADH-quinone reductase subunit F [Flavobacteriales bacterium]
MDYTSQELHQIAMTTAGKKLESKHFEFLAINSGIKKSPQFIARKDGKLSFVLVKFCLYPENPESYDTIWMETIKAHAKEKEARLYFIGVGFANSNAMEKPPSKNDDLLIKFSGKIERIL